MKNGKSIMEIIVDTPQKIKTRIPYDPTILPFGIYLKEIYIDILQDTYISKFTAALLRIAK